MTNMERLTQRARRVMTLAEEAAAQFKQPTVGSEHILLGLMRETYGLASRVLRDVGLEQKRVADLIAELDAQSESTASSDHHELSPEAQQLIALAMSEAYALNQRYVGTEHLLLGLLRQEDSMALRVLKRFDIRLDEVRRQTERLLQEAPPVSLDASEDDEPTSVQAPPNQSTSEAAEPQSSDMTMVIVSRVLEMLSANKLTSTQAGELLRALPLDLTLTPAGKARFASMVNHSAEDAKRRVRITVYDSATKSPQFEMVNSLDSMLRFVDYFLHLVADNDFESLVLDGDSSPIITELKIERDESM